MPIRFHSSNRVEKLQENLCRQLSEHPLSSPLAGEVVIVPTFAMSRWLNLRIAQHLGVAANIDYPLPAAWLWQLARQVIDDLPHNDPLALEVMAWKIFRLLPDLIEQSEFSEIKRYLANDRDGIKRWQLSQRIAEVFDRYQHYRPDLIREWSAKRVSNWQAILWQTLIQDLPGGHRVDILDRLIDRFKMSETVSHIPQRASLFAISSLPPLTIEVLLALSQHMDITFYQHSPTDQYFADLKSSRSLSKLELSNPDEVGYYDTGNELLASWGRQAQTMQTLLLQQEYQIEQEIAYHYPPGNRTLLQSIHQSIFDLDTTPINTQADGSVTIHICHSAMRECQVLHDQLLKMLDDNPQLGTEDILIMVPEINHYAPYIEAVFGYEDRGDKPYLPWNLSDISIIDEHPLVQSFLQLLRLPTSRFEISEIMSLLQVAEIRRHFNLDETAISDIQQWLEASHVRWGIDDSFKLEFGLPATIQNTWSQARNRLFAGYALGNDELWNSIAALNNIDNSTALNIAKFFDLFDRLDHWRRKLQVSTQATDWIIILNDLLDDFYTGIDSTEHPLQEIRDCIDALHLADNCNISVLLIRHWLEAQLGRQQRQGRLFSGGVTFCGMRPMRNLPYQIICLMGMNDDAFPRRLPHYDFDILNQQYRLGDPGSADEDRYLMLETLLCARHSFYISYTGRSLKDNSICQPSVLVNELIDFIDSQTSAEGSQQKLSSQLIQLHPMQAFSPGNFITPLFSYDKSWCLAAKFVQSKPSAREIDWSTSVPASDQQSFSGIDPGELKRFLQHPLKYFFNSRLKIYFERDSEFVNEENFIVDALSGWQLRSRLADYVLKGQHNYQALMRAEGLLPHGNAGAIMFDDLQRQHSDWLQQLMAYSEFPREPVMINIDLGAEGHLAGQIEAYYPGQGIMHYTASRINGPSILKLWIDHLCLCVDGHFSSDEISYLIASDQTIAYKAIESNQALSHLAELCSIYLKGQCELLPIFPKSSFAFAQEPDRDKALSTAIKAWHSSRYGTAKGDEDDAYIQLALRSTTQLPLYLPDFSSYATTVYEAALAHRIKP